MRIYEGIISSGKTVINLVRAYDTYSSLLGTNMRSLNAKTDKAFGQELFNAAADGQITEVSYMFPRPGEDVPVHKVSFVTGIGDIGCSVGYFK